MSTNSCTNALNAHNRRLNIHKRKLTMLTYIRDALERRIASVNASIETLEGQIKRDESLDFDPKTN